MSVAGAPAAVPSPCIAICRMDAVTGWCEGCLRTLDEIAAWSRMDNGGKTAVWAQLDARRPQWEALLFERGGVTQASGAAGCGGACGSCDGRAGCTLRGADAGPGSAMHEAAIQFMANATHPAKGPGG